MSNAVETELKGLINELQGLYRQCAADNAEMKRKITALEEKILPLETDIDELYSRIDALKSDLDIVIEEQSKDRQRIKALESEMMNKVNVEKHLDQLLLINKRLKQLEGK